MGPSEPSAVGLKEELMLIKLIVPFCVLLLTIIHALSTQWQCEDSSSLLRMDHPGERGDQNVLFFAHSILACCHSISYIVTDASRVLLHKQKIVPRVVSAEREMNLAFPCLVLHVSTQLSSFHLTSTVAGMA